MALLERLVLALELDANGAVSKAQQFQQEIGRALTPVEKLQQQLKLGFNIGLGAAGASSLVDGVKQGAVAITQTLASQAKASVNAAAEDRQAQIVLAGVIRNTTDARYSDLVAVESQIDKLQRLTGVADDDLRPAFSTLVRTTNDVAEASDLLSVALDTAAGTGTDVGAVADALAKAFNGQTRALRLLTPELGGLIRDGASATEIVARLKGEFGGLAEASANPLQRLKVAAGEAQETIGYALLPAVDALTSAAVSSDGPVNEIALTLGALTQGALQAAPAIRDLGGAFINYLIPGVSQAKSVLRGGIFGTESGTVLASTLNARDAFADVFNTVAEARGWGTRLGNEALTAADGFDAAAFKVADFSSVLSAAFGVFDAQNGFDSALASLTDAQTSGGAAAKQRALSEFEIESAARSVKQAEDELAEAEKNLADIRKGASEDEKRRAEQEVANAAQRSRVANVRLAEAENNLRRANARGTVAEQTKAQLEYEQAVLDVQNATQDAADAQKQKTEVDNRGKEGSRELADAVKRVEDAQWAVKSAYESQRRLFEQDAATGGPGAKVGRSMESAFLSAQKAAGNIVDEMLKAGKPIDEITAKARELEAANIAAGQAAGLPESLLTKASAYYDYLVALAKYQNYLNTTFKNGTDPDGFEGLYLKGLVDSAKDRFEGAGRAAGGSVAGGVLYRVNESRAEYFKPNGSGTIVPLSGGGGMGGTYNFYLQGSVIATDSDLERLIIDTLERAKRRGWN